MQIFTLYFHFKKMLGLPLEKKADQLIIDGLSDSFEPSEKTISNLLAYSNAYRFEKSDALGEIEYLIN